MGLLLGGQFWFLSNGKHTLVGHLHHTVNVVDVGTLHRSVFFLCEVGGDSRDNTMNSATSILKRTHIAGTAIKPPLHKDPSPLQSDNQ